MVDLSSSLQHQVFTGLKKEVVYWVTSFLNFFNFFFLLSQLPVITTGKTYKQWALEVKLYMGKAAHCERAASEATD